MINNYSTDQEFSFCTLPELAQLIVNGGSKGGINLEVIAQIKCESFIRQSAIVVTQNEWMESPVCFMGGYGKEVQAIRPDSSIEEVIKALMLYNPTNKVAYREIEFLVG